MRTVKTIEEQLGIEQSKKDKDITRAIEKAGAFYCFDNARFEELKQKGVEYYNYGGGLVCPIDTVKQLSKDITRAVKKDIERDIEANGKDNIIKRVFCDFEGNEGDTIEYLKGYDITADEIIKATKGIRFII